MPQYEYTMETGETGAIWALNVYDASEELYYQYGDEPERLTEVV